MITNNTINNLQTKKSMSQYNSVQFLILTDRKSRQPLRSGPPLTDRQISPLKYIPITLVITHKQMLLKYLEQISRTGLFL